MVAPVLQRALIKLGKPFPRLSNLWGKAGQDEMGSVYVAQPQAQLVALVHRLIACRAPWAIVPASPEGFTLSTHCNAKRLLETNRCA